MSDTKNFDPAAQPAETEMLSLGAPLANLVYAKLQAATEYADFYRTVKRFVGQFATEATEHRTHDSCHNYSLCMSMVVLLTETMLDAHRLAGEGTPFATVRAQFMERLDAQFRLYAKLHTYRMTKADADQYRADQAAVAAKEGVPVVAPAAPAKTLH